MIQSRMVIPIRSYFFDGSYWFAVLFTRWRRDSNNAGRSLLRFAVATIPAMENSRSTAADDGNATLYFINRSRTYGYCFSDCSALSLSSIMMKNSSQVKKYLEKVSLKKYLKVSRYFLKVSWRYKIRYFLKVSWDTKIR